MGPGVAEGLRRSLAGGLGRLASRPNPLHHASADAALARHLADAPAFGKRRPDGLLDLAVDARPPAVSALRLGASNAGANALGAGSPGGGRSAGARLGASWRFLGVFTEPANQVLDIAQELVFGSLAS